MATLSSKKLLSPVNASNDTRAQLYATEVGDGGQNFFVLGDEMPTDLDSVSALSFNVEYRRAAAKTGIQLGLTVGVYEGMSVASVSYGGDYKSFSGYVPAGRHSFSRLKHVTQHYGDATGAGGGYYILGGTDGSSNRGFVVLIGDAGSVSGWSASGAITAWTSEDSLPEQMLTNSDGTRYYVLGRQNAKIYSYANNGTAYSINSVSYDSSDDFTISQDSSPTDFKWAPDGLTFYVLGNATKTIYQYVCSTAWDMGTASYDNKSLDLSNEITIGNIYSFCISPNGRRIIVSAPNDIQPDSDCYGFQYSLSTAWDIDTASYDTSTAGLASKFIDTDYTGAHLFGLETWSEPHMIRRLSVWNTSALARGSTVQKTINADITNTTDTSTGATSFDYVNTSAGRNAWQNALVRFDCLGVQITSASYTLSPSAPLATSDNSYLEIPLTGANPGYNEVTVDMSSAPTGIDHLINSAWEVEYSVDTPPTGTSALKARWVNKAYPTTTSYGSALLEAGTSTTLLAVSPDGSTVITTVSGTVKQRTLSTPFNMGTMGSTTDVTGMGSYLPFSSNSVRWHPDGNMVFALHSSSAIIAEYSTSNFDLTGLGSTPDGPFKTFTVPGGYTDLTGFCWSDDGNKLYVIFYATGINDEYILQKYHASTPWDVSTLGSYVQQLALPDNIGYTLWVDNEGRRLVFKQGEVNIDIAYLTTAHDLTTFSSRGSRTIYYPQTSERSFLLSDDLEKYVTLSKEPVV